MAAREESRLKEVAEGFRLRLEHRLCVKADVVAWADEEIGRAAHPDPSITDISLAVTASPQDVLGLLRAVPGAIDVPTALRRFLGELADTLRSNPEKAEEIARILSHMALCGEAPDSLAERPMLSFEGEFELAKFTGKDEREIASRLLLFLDDQAGAVQPAVAADGAWPRR